MLGMGFVHSWEILTVLRALLGVFEAGREYYPHDLWSKADRTKCFLARYT